MQGALLQRGGTDPIPMSYCVLSCGARTLRGGGSKGRSPPGLSSRREGREPKKGERKGVPFEHRFGVHVADMEVTLISVLAPPARRCLLQLVVVVSGVRVPVGEGSDGGIAHAWSWSR